MKYSFIILDAGCCRYAEKIAIPDYLKTKKEILSYLDGYGTCYMKFNPDTFFVSPYNIDDMRIVEETGNST